MRRGMPAIAERLVRLGDGPDRFLLRHSRCGPDPDGSVSSPAGRNDGDSRTSGSDVQGSQTGRRLQEAPRSEPRRRRCRGGRGPAGDAGIPADPGVQQEAPRVEVGGVSDRSGHAAADRHVRRDRRSRFEDHSECAEDAGVDGCSSRHGQLRVSDRRGVVSTEIDAEGGVSVRQRSGPV